MKKTILFLFITSAFLSLSSCGKKSSGSGATNGGVCHIGDTCKKANKASTTPLVYHE